MLKVKSCLEIEVNGRKYEFYCQPDSPIEHAKEAVFQFSKYLGQIEDNAKAQLTDKEQTEKIEDNQENVNDQPPV